MLTNFSTDLLFSFANVPDDLYRLRAYFPERVAITKTDTATDKAGADYIIHLPGGGYETVDVKRRREGCERYWASPHIPELALELVADVATDRPGWAVVDAPLPDWFLFAFPNQNYLFDAANLRAATRKYAEAWTARYGMRETRSECDGRVWVSQFVAVPVNVLRNAIDEYQPAPHPASLGTLPRGLRDF